MSQPIRRTRSTGSLITAGTPPLASHRWAPPWIVLLILPLSLMLYACSRPSPSSEASATPTPEDSPTEPVPCVRTTPGATLPETGCAIPPTDRQNKPIVGEDDHAMDLGPADATYDLRFIDAMGIHHQGAVAMAEAALTHSQRPEIRQLAEVIIAAQTQEIAQMQQWRQAWYPEAGPEPIMYHGAMHHDMAMSETMAAAMRMDRDLGTADDEFDLRFIDAMIPHHQGALVMAQDAQTKSTRADIQALAAAILATQQAEMDQMQQWRTDWYGQEPLAPSDGI